jgi:outer membrane receptor protein involved in Fe transport
MLHVLAARARMLVALSFLLLLVPRSLPAAPAAAASLTGPVGRVAGKVTDSSGKPLPDASVHVLGAGSVLADNDGRFLIPALPVGRATLEVRLMGYGIQRAEVAIDAGRTATADFALTEVVTRTIPVMEVHGKPTIDRTRTDTRHEVGRDKLNQTPVEDYREVVALEPGIVNTAGELHVRGSRGDQVKTLVSGFDASAPAFATPVQVATAAIENIQVVTGGFGAEEASALAGAIKIETREGRETLGGELRWDTDRFGDPGKTFDNYDRVSLGFGGPTPIHGITYFVTYEGTFQDGYLKSSVSRPQRTLLDFITLGSRQSNQVNTNLKLAWSDSANKFTAETINNRAIRTPYNHMWSRQGYVKVTYDTIRAVGQPDAYSARYGTWSPTRIDDSYQPMNLPDHLPTVDDRYSQQTLMWTHTTRATAWTTRLANLHFATLSSVGRKEPWEYWIQSPFYWNGNIQFGSENNPYFATHGDFPNYFHREQSTWALKSDYSTRRWNKHTAKTGLLLQYNEIRNLGLLLPNSETNGLPGAARSDFVNYNPEGAAYVQDRWDFEGLVLNVGMRFDDFTPGDQIADADLRSGKRHKQQLSPRLGIAYPITDRDVLSFHYGWTYQTPARNFIFENRGLNASVAVRGNPDLEPETNIAYQAGVQHLFSKDVSGQFSLFFNDYFGLITARQERDGFGNLVNVFQNGDYASARGFEASIIKSFSHKFSAEANYTYSLATGVASNPLEALQFFNGGRLYLPISELPLDWDQRHTLSVQSVVRDPGKWGFRMLWTYSSGLPYTPSFRNDRRPDPARKNSRRLPGAARLTIAGDKFYRVWGQNMTLFFDARNVLDAKIIAALSQPSFPNPYIFDGGQDDYTVYFTETGRTGGAYLQDTNGDNVLDWVALRDPRVLEEGRSVRLGMSLAF